MGGASATLRAAALYSHLSVLLDCSRAHAAERVVSRTAYAVGKLAYSITRVGTNGADDCGGGLDTSARDAVLYYFRAADHQSSAWPNRPRRMANFDIGLFVHHRRRKPKVAAA